MFYVGRLAFSFAYGQRRWWPPHRVKRAQSSPCRRQDKHSYTLAGPPGPLTRVENLGCLLNECALLLWRELRHAPVFIGHTKRCKNLSGNSEIGMIHMGPLDGLWDFQRHLAKLVARHFMRFPRRLFFLWPTISPRTMRRSTRVRFFSIASVSSEICGISQRYSATNQVGFSVVIQFK